MYIQLDSEQAQGVDSEDLDEYRAINTFWVLPEARWSCLRLQARQPTIGELVDEVMSCVERNNQLLKDGYTKTTPQTRLKNTV